MVMLRYTLSIRKTGFCLMLTGRTLMGHDSAKNQQMDDHYFGTVVAVLERGSMGLTVYVRHENGFATVYAGLEKAHVSVGTTVAAGDIIGTAGADGMHFGIYANGVPCDPKAYISGLTQ